MSNVRYPYGNQKILEGQIPWSGNQIVALLVGTQTYSYNPVHRYLTDIPVSARVAMSGTLTNTSATMGVADADDVFFPAVPTGPRADAVILIHATGAESTSTLIAYLSDGVGLPVTPDGSNIRVVWDNGANKVFVL